MAVTHTTVMSDHNTNPIIKLGGDINPDSPPAAVFDISPETALHLLCTNVERLAALVATPGADELNCPGSAVSECEDLSQDGAREIETVGLHVKSEADVVDPARATAEAIQMTILSKKFLSKKVPPISLQDYLLRLHKFCPMSTAVYLAASVYISKMTLVENVLRVLPKNMHRLVLAGVWVASKALEDLSYAHSRVAKVGGVSELELSKLEISFCFLVDFELRVDVRMLMDEALRPQADIA
ncbi:unnamed protein product [Penicillium olsonii]|uniref:Uncharacterized protein n=1 Tax=Penicillium olsonii TaxID=99116 RepID=A0A9W4N889_PENOL|nr:unnamed protein product [Penicillium olsonii]CAG8287414.1 unnamed protein product [Penicillium olsonii]